MKRFLSFLSVVLLMAVQAVNGMVHESYAYDESGNFSFTLYYDDVADTYDVAMDMIYNVEEDMVFPGQFKLKFEDYDGNGNDREEYFYYRFETGLDMVANGSIVKSITFEEGIEEIPADFAGYNYMDCHTYPSVLEKVVLPHSLKRIGARAFAYHENLKSIVFGGYPSDPDALEEIGDEAFIASHSDDMMAEEYFSNLEECEVLRFFELDNQMYSEPTTNLKVIGARAFKGHNLGTVQLPPSLQSIGSEAFANTTIREIQVHNANLALTESPFAGSTIGTGGVEIVSYSEEGVFEIPAHLMDGVGSEFDLTLRLSKSIFNYIELNSVTMVHFQESCLRNSGVRNIDFLTHTLDHITWVDSPVYPFNVGFEAYALAGTSKLNRLNFLGSKDDVSVEAILQPKSWDLSEVTANNITIGDYAFQNSGIEEIKLSNTVNVIGDNAFQGSHLKSIEIPAVVNPHTGDAAVLQLGEGAFANTKYLEKADLKCDINGVGSDNFLPKQTFYKSNVSEISLPTTIDWIGERAFEGTKIKSFTGWAALEQIDEAAFADCKELASVDLSGTKVDILKQQLFLNNSKLTELKLPEKIDQLRPSCLEGTALKSFDINASHVDHHAIYNMPELESVRFTHPSLKVVNENCLVSLPKLETVDFGEYVTALNKNFISDCPSFTDLVITPAIENINKDAFDGVKDNLATINLKSDELADLADASESPFDGFFGSLFIDESVKIVKDYYFAYSHITNNIEIPYDLLIQEHAFENADIDTLDWHYPDETYYPFKSAYVYKLTFSNMTDIKQNGLFQEAYIRNLYLEGLTDISGEYVFEEAYIPNDDRNNTLIIPASMKSIGASAFRNVDTDKLLFEKGAGLTIGSRAFARTANDYDSYAYITTRYDKSNIPVAADDAFECGDKGAAELVFAGGCEDVAAYKAADGWKDIKTQKWDGVTDYKYSFEIVGEKFKRPIEEYKYDISVNDVPIADTYIGCSNPVNLKFYSPCSEMTFDHWADGSTDPEKYTFNIESDTVIRIYVKEETSPLKIQLSDPSLSDMVKLYMRTSDGDSDWEEKTSMDVNYCSYGTADAKVELLDESHYSFLGWYDEKDKLFSSDRELYWIGEGQTLTAKVELNTYGVMIEFEPCMMCYGETETDHLEVNGANVGTSYSDYLPYGTSVTVKFFGKNTPSERYIIDYWKDDMGNILSEKQELTFTVGDGYYHIYPVIKMASSYAITAKASDDALGSATVTPIDDAETSKGSGLFWEGSKIELNAMSKGMHSYFKQWNDGSIDNPHTITVSKAFDYVAEFAKDSFNVAIQVEGVPAEFVEVKGAGRYGYDDEVTLSYTLKDDHYTFEHWFGEKTFSDDAEFKFNVQKSENVRIVFSPKNYEVKVVANPAEGGTIKGAGSVPYNSNLILTATANEGYRFNSWADDKEAEAERIAVVVCDTTFTANFDKIIYYTISVATSDDKLGTVKGGGTVEENQTVDIEAEAAEHCHFIQWSDGNTDAKRTITATATVTYTAQFAMDTHTITVGVNDEKMGSAKGSGVFEYGKSVEISATTNEGFHFVQWNDGNTDATRNVTVTADATFTAQFAVNIYTISVASADEKMGSVTGGGVFEHGQTATLTATAAEGHHFVQWADGNTDNPRSVVATKDEAFSAQFAVNTYTISVLSADDKMGSVKGGGVYEFGKVAELTATAQEGYHFTQWKDGNTDNPRSVTVSSDSIFLAQFVKDDAITFTITVLSANEDQGIVTGGGVVEKDKTTTLTATAKEGYHFVQWADGNTDNPRVVTATANASYIAQFAINTYTISVVSADDKMGTVSGSGVYDFGKSVEISASAKEGYHFVQWADGNTEAVRTITVSKDDVFVAQFVKDDAVTFTIIVTASAGGSVSGGGVFESGKTVQITAVANSGYHFTQWSDGNTEAVRTITVTADDSYTAYFAKDAEADKYTVIVVSDESMGSVVGGGEFKDGEKATIGAVAAEGYKFVQWSDGNTDNPRIITVNADIILVAQFVSKDVETFSILVSSIDVNKGTAFGSGTYGKGQTTSIFAVPAEGYVFSQWSDGNTDNPRTITVAENANYVAMFEQKSSEVKQYTITIAANDETMGVVQGAYGEFTLDEGTIRVVKAVAKKGYHFVRWENGATNPVRVITVTTNYNYIAYFEADAEPTPTFTINVLSSNEQQGTVTGGGEFEDNTVIIISAAANEGYMFVQWSDGSKDAVRAITVTGNANFVATFAEKVELFTITVLSANDAQGVVTGGGSFEAGKEITIAAVPAEGYEFIQWNDGNTDNPRTIVVSENANFIAQFAEKQVVVPTYTITINFDSEKGSVIGGGEYEEGTVISLAAVPAEGYKFTQWSDGNTENPREITVTSNITLTAVFDIVEALINVEANEDMQVRKVMIDGQIYIIRGDKMYNILGAEVK